MSPQGGVTPILVPKGESDASWESLLVKSAESQTSNLTVAQSHHLRLGLCEKLTDKLSRLILEVALAESHLAPDCPLKMASADLEYMGLIVLGKYTRLMRRPRRQANSQQGSHIFLFIFLSFSHFVC